MRMADVSGTKEKRCKKESVFRHISWLGPNYFNFGVKYTLGLSEEERQEFRVKAEGVIRSFSNLHRTLTEKRIREWFCNPNCTFLQKDMVLNPYPSVYLPELNEYLSKSSDVDLNSLFSLIQNKHTSDTIKYRVWQTNSVITDLIKEYGNKEFVLVAPDAGASKRTEKVFEHITQRFEENTIFFLQLLKTRDSNGEPILTSAGDISGSDNKTAIIINDIIDGGRTYINIAKYLKAQGFKRVVLVVTHCIFSYGNNDVFPNVDIVYTENLEPRPLEERFLNGGNDAIITHQVNSAFNTKSILANKDSDEIIGSIRYL